MPLGGMTLNFVLDSLFGGIDQRVQLRFKFVCGSFCLWLVGPDEVQKLLRVGLGVDLDPHHSRLLDIVLQQKQIHTEAVGCKRDIEFSMSFTFRQVSGLEFKRSESGKVPDPPSAWKRFAPS